MSRERLEKEIENTIIRAYPNAFALKLYKRHWPDRLFLLPGGRCFFVEFKRHRKKLRPGQEQVKHFLEKKGFSVYRIDSIENGKLLFNLLGLNDE